MDFWLSCNMNYSKKNRMGYFEAHPHEKPTTVIPFWEPLSSTRATRYKYVFM